MDKEDRSSGFDKAKLIFLLMIPVLVWNIDYHAQDPHFTFCLFRNITGRDCYGCGLLRGISALLHFDLGEIPRLNRLNPFTIPLIAWIYWKQLVRAIGALQRSSHSRLTTTSTGSTR